MAESQPTSEDLAQLSDQELSKRKLIEEVRTARRENTRAAVFWSGAQAALTVVLSAAVAVQGYLTFQLSNRVEATEALDKRVERLKSLSALVSSNSVGGIMLLRSEFEDAAKDKDQETREADEKMVAGLLESVLTTSNDKVAMDVREEAVFAIHQLLVGAPNLKEKGRRAHFFFGDAKPRVPGVIGPAFLYRRTSGSQDTDVYKGGREENGYTDAVVANSLAISMNKELMEDAYLPGMILVDVAKAGNRHFDGAKFKGANLSHCTFEVLTLKDVCFKYADLSYCTIKTISGETSQADLSKADFTGADLRHATIWVTDEANMPAKISGASVGDVLGRDGKPNTAFIKWAIDPKNGGVADGPPKRP